MARKIGGLLGRSAFGPLYEHMVQVVKTARLLKQLASEFVAGDFARVKAAAQRVDVEEAEADRIKDEIRRHLTQSFFSAVQRSDTLLVLALQDNIADNANDTAKLLSVRKTSLPEGLHPRFLSFTEAVVHTTELLLDRTRALHETLESGSERPRLHEELEKLQAVHQAQFQASQQHRQFLEGLFAVEGEVDPVTTIILMQIASRLELVAQAAENTAECLERMVAQR